MAPHTVRTSGSALSFRLNGRTVVRIRSKSLVTRQSSWIPHTYRAVIRCVLQELPPVSAPSGRVPVPVSSPFHANSLFGCACPLPVCTFADFSDAYEREGRYRGARHLRAHCDGRPSSSAHCPAPVAAESWRKLCNQAPTVLALGIDWIARWGTARAARCASREHAGRSAAAVECSLALALPLSDNVEYCLYSVCNLCDLVGSRR